jgi:flagellar hook-basal body complex protein FliE
MDGLTIRSSDNLVQKGQTASELRNSQITPPSVESGDEVGKSFADTLSDAVNNVNTLQKKSDVAMQQLATGKTDNIPEVMIASEKADIAMKLMVSMRNKVIDAYHEVMKMQF